MKEIIANGICFVLIFITLSACNKKQEINSLNEILNKAIIKYNDSNYHLYFILLKEAETNNIIRISFQIEKVKYIENILKHTLELRESFIKEINDSITPKKLFLLVDQYEKLHKSYIRDSASIDTKIFYKLPKKHLSDLSITTLKLFVRWDIEAIFENELQDIANRMTPRRCEIGPLKLDELSKNQQLYRAIYDNKLFVVKRLISQGADKNYKIPLSDIYFLPVLSYAVMYNRKDIYEYLLEEGADINAVDSENNNTLSVACGINNIELVKLLVEKGANIEIPESRMPPLMIAKLSENHEVVKYLKSKLKEKN